MTQFLLRFTLTFLGWFALASGTAHAFNVAISQSTLGNGLQLIVIEDHRAPIVFHAIGYKVGAADQPAGKTGLAHFFEHLLFKATKNRPLGTFDRLMDENGAQKNAFTTQDATVFWERSGRELLPQLMDIEADRMKNLILTDDIVATELKVVQEERRQRTESEPSAILGEKMDAALFTVHPYGRPVVGLPEDVAKLTRADAETFYRQHYQPANAIVLVVGDVDPAQVKSIAEKYYGPLLNDVAVTAVPHTAEPPGKHARRESYADARVSTPSWSRKYLAPAFAKVSAREAAALELLGVIIGGTSQSRLSQALVFGDKSASAAGAGYNGDMEDYGSFVVYAVPSAGVSVDRVEKSVDAVIAELSKDGPTQAELDDARQQAIADYVYALDMPIAFGRMMGIGLATGVPRERILTRDASYNDVTVADVRQAAQKILRVENSVTGVLSPMMTAQ